VGDSRAIAILGAGSVGLVLGARLARAGRTVRFHVRREEAARALREGGVVVEDPASGGYWRAAVEAEPGPPRAAGPVFVCVRGPDNEAVAASLAAVAPAAVPVNVQNGVAGDAVFARRFTRVIGAVWRAPCTRVEPNRVRTLRDPRVILGLHPAGEGPDVESLADLLRGAGLDVGVSRRIAEDRWLKLCVNLTSSPNALVRQDEHASAAFVEIKVRLLEEARMVLAAAGIAARSCDGRDRSLDAEIEWHRGSLAQGEAARRMPLYNSTWSALAHGLPLETDEYHRTVCMLGGRHGIATPVNARVLEALERAREGKLGPECYGAEELAGRCGSR
jgi:2-dehydropantoate 2-reductase